MISRYIFIITFFIVDIIINKICFISPSNFSRAILSARQTFWLDNRAAQQSLEWFVLWRRWPSDRPEMAQQNTNGWSHTEGNLQNQNQGTDQPVQVDLRVHKAAEVPNVHAPATPKDSLQNDDFWTVRELLWGILIIVISITVLLLVGWALAFKIPHARPKWMPL